VSETSHVRSRRAALIGLFVQVLIALALFVLSIYVHSNAIALLAWYVAAGTPIWFVTLLVFRQHELAEFEKLDLDELRREKQATGGGEAMFAAEGGGGLGFLVAKTRLEWMQRWLVPIFGLVTGVLLAAIAVSNWMALR